MYDKKNCYLKTMEENWEQIRRDSDKRRYLSVDVTRILNKVQNMINTFKPYSMETLTEPLTVCLSSTYLNKIYEEQGVPYKYFEAASKDVLIPTLINDFGYSARFKYDSFLDGTVIGYSVVIQLYKK